MRQFQSTRKAYNLPQSSGAGEAECGKFINTRTTVSARVLILLKTRTAIISVTHIYRKEKKKRLRLKCTLVFLAVLQSYTADSKIHTKIPKLFFQLSCYFKFK